MTEGQTLVCTFIVQMSGKRAQQFDMVVLLGRCDTGEDLAQHLHCSGLLRG